MDALRTRRQRPGPLRSGDERTFGREANLRKAERLLGQIPVAIAAHLPPEQGDRRSCRRGPTWAHAANFLYMLRGEEPDADDVRALDVSLILYAEHEFNASTFTARVVCSTESDLHSASWPPSAP